MKTQHGRDVEQSFGGAAAQSEGATGHPGAAQERVLRDLADLAGKTLGGEGVRQVGLVVAVCLDESDSLAGACQPGRQSPGIGVAGRGNRSVVAGANPRRRGRRARKGHRQRPGSIR